MHAFKLLGTISTAIWVLAASSIIVNGQDDAAAYRLASADEEQSSPPTTGTVIDRPPDIDGCNTGCDLQSSCSRWTATADFIIFERIGGIDQILIRSGTAGAELLNANDFNQGFFGGPRLGLIRHGDNGYDIEMLYFQIDGWSSTRQVAPDNHLHVFNAPGGFTVGTLDEIMQFNYASKLYNAEVNVRWNPLCRVTVLAGFRWLELRENLEGVTIPSVEETFWNTNTKNNLFGFQIGAEGVILDRGCFSIDGVLKAGIFGNHAEQSAAAHNSNVMDVFTASTNHTSFLGEIGLMCKYQVTSQMTLRAGYEALWLQGVALAPAQIQESNVLADQIGINSNNGVFYHGATAGFEFSF